MQGLPALVPTPFAPPALDHLGAAGGIEPLSSLGFPAVRDGGIGGSMVNVTGTAGTMAMPMQGQLWVGWTPGFGGALAPQTQVNGGFALDFSHVAGNAWSTPSEQWVASGSTRTSCSLSLPPQALLEGYQRLQHVLAAGLAGASAGATTLEPTPVNEELRRIQEDIAAKEVEFAKALREAKALAEKSHSYLGVFARRFDDHLLGYGFIECRETMSTYGRDIFMKSHVGVEIGDYVTFQVKKSLKGPVAASVRRLKDLSQIKKELTALKEKRTKAATPGGSASNMSKRAEQSGLQPPVKRSRQG